jgi:hypothetical protein
LETFELVRSTSGKLEDPGDISCFDSGQADIAETIRKLVRRSIPTIEPDRDPVG